MIDEINWHALKPYQNDKYGSFEQLCYQIAKRQFERDGDFTSIEGSGGDDGVEFYMTLSNGDIWGWQVKFYPSGTLKEGNRREQVKESLRAAVVKRPRLVKWFLCTPHDLGKDDDNWFKNNLRTAKTKDKPIVPSDRIIGLVAWGEAHFNEQLSKPANKGLLSFFFGSLELSAEWFSEQSSKNLTLVEDRFIPSLHIERHVDEAAHLLIGDKKASEIIISELAEAKEILARIQTSQSKVMSYKEDPRLLWNGDKSLLEESITSVITSLKEYMAALLSAHAQLEKGLFKLLIDQNVDISRIAAIEARDKYLEESKCALKNIKILTEEDAAKAELKHEIEYAFYEIDSTLERVLNFLQYIEGERIFAFKRTDLHVLGAAGLGKTHFAASLAKYYLDQRLPAIFIPAMRLSDGQSIESQFLSLLDIPTTYSWGDFIEAVDIYGSILGVQIPIIIDGLNETLDSQGRLSEIWKKHLKSFTHSIEKSRLRVITTCRRTYIKAIWGTYPDNAEYLSQLDYTELKEAIRKYFNHYKIIANLAGAPIEHFNNPLYLKIYCETVNPSRQGNVAVQLSELALFDVFERYLKRCSDETNYKLDFRPEEKTAENVAEILAKYLWENSTRAIPIDIAMSQINDTASWSKSKMHALLSAGLFIDRDWHEDGTERVQFTYDLFAGFAIAKYLLGTDIATLMKSETFKSKLLAEDRKELHPLYDDILQCTAGLLPSMQGSHLHDFNQDKLLGYSVRALFEIQPQHVRERDTKLVEKLFQIPKNHGALLELFMKSAFHPNHPLNMSFTSGLLEGMSIQERDLSWSEQLRKSDDIVEILDELEMELKSTNDTPSENLPRIHQGAQFAMWALTTTRKPVRDQSTRVLYWYARTFTDDAWKMTKRSLGFNDPYISERMLAAIYGASMACWHDKEFKATLLGLSKELFANIFAADAPYPSTHILARDYASKTIALALLLDSTLLSPEEAKMTQPPFAYGQKRIWGSGKDKNEHDYRDGNYPLGFDFKNYTIGRLIKNRSPYDDNARGYRTVVANMWWRIYQLGYSLTKFGEIDQAIARSHYPYDRKADGGKTDRYGKKYAWIAFYEIAGCRQDKGLLPEKGDERISDLDIDPSFPIDEISPRLLPQGIIQQAGDAHAWLHAKDTSGLEPILVRKDIHEHKGPWVCLDGVISSENGAREQFAILHSAFLRQSDLASFMKEYRKFPLTETVSIPGDYYTYAGEIPWCHTYPYNESSLVSVKVDEKDTYYETQDIAFFKAGKQLSDEESGPIFEKVFGGSFIRMLALTGINDPELQKLTDLGIEARIIRVRHSRKEDVTHDYEVWSSVRENKWEDYHSAVQPGRSIATPSKQLSEFLQLSSRAQTFNMYDNEGAVAYVWHRSDGDWHDRESLSYLRKDKLDDYLKKEEFTLVYFVRTEKLLSKTERPQNGQGIDRSPKTITNYDGVYTYDPKRGFGPLFVYRSESYSTNE